MMYATDLCSSYHGSIKITFYDADTKDYITSIMLYDGFKGISALTYAYMYATVDSMYVNSDGVICCSAYIQ